MFGRTDFCILTQAIVHKDTHGQKIEEVVEKGDVRVNKKLLTIGLGVILLSGGLLAWRSFSSEPATASAITTTVQKGDVRKIVTATGTINYPLSIPLSFSLGGKITGISVRERDSVQKGQVLAQLDTTILRQTVVQSEANLVAAQARMRQLEDGFNEQTKAQAQLAVAKAEQGVSNAQVQLTTAEDNADPDYVADQVSLAELNVSLASDTLVSALNSGSASAIQQAQNSLDQAEAALVKAQKARDGGAAQSLAAAQATYQAAQADRINAKAQFSQQEQGPRSGDVQVAQAGIDQATAALEIAQINLANATLTAPIDGVITSLNSQNYQYVGTNPIMTLSSGTGTLQVDTTVDQADISLVKVGQKADITLDSAPDQHISGTVSSVAPQGTIVQSVTTFEVTITIDESNSLLQAGMNANVSIIVAEAKNVLIIPSEAIQQREDRNGVLVMGNVSDASGTGVVATNNSPETQWSENTAGLAGINAFFVPVEIGLDDGTNLEIKNGLSEGQEIIVGIQSLSKSNLGGLGSMGTSGGTTQTPGEFKKAAAP